LIRRLGPKRALSSLIGRFRKGFHDLERIFEIPFKEFPSRTSLVLFFHESSWRRAGRFYDSGRSPARFIHPFMTQARLLPRRILPLLNFFDPFPSLPELRNIYKTSVHSYLGMRYFSSQFRLSSRTIFFLFPDIARLGFVY